MDAFSKAISPDGERKTNQPGHRYPRSFILNHSGAESIKEKLLSQLEELIYRNLGSWSKHDSVELKRAFSMMVCKFTSRQMFGRDAERLRQSTAEKLTNFIQVLMSFPLNIPGTRFHKCLEEKMEVTSTLREIVKEKQASHDDKMHEGDILSQLVKDMKTEKFAQEDFVVKILFSTLFATTETNSSIISLALKLLSENPSAIEQLQVEHEEILRNRPKSSSSVTWDEYKSMTFTLQVTPINVFKFQIMHYGFYPRCLQKSYMCLYAFL
ncbi:cytochrome P450 87A3-like [Coffea eugenioides]|uniref:cytochrome P450 87A3-like n=1 Tax=Coffea eugenioides TaxID=49369 RepID=UPI000F60630F|nr:cytochrome P450 87A3-like [Coffea eugenioides]